MVSFSLFFGTACHCHALQSCGAVLWGLTLVDVNSSDRLIRHILLNVIFIECD